MAKKKKKVIDRINLISWISGLIIALITITLTVEHFKASKTITYIEKIKFSRYD